MKKKQQQEPESAESFGALEQLVLAGVIALRKDAYGLAVYRQVAELNGGREVMPGAIYVTLDRLERKGILSSEVTEPLPERGGHTKRIYSLTPEGMKAIEGVALTTARVHSIFEKFGRLRKWRQQTT